MRTNKDILHSIIINTGSGTIGMCGIINHLIFLQFDIFFIMYILVFIYGIYSVLRDYKKLREI